MSQTRKFIFGFEGKKSSLQDHKQLIQNMESKFFITPSVKEQIPPYVLEELKQMPTAKQAQFVQEFKRKCKNSFGGFVLAFLGLHYIYLGKWGMFFIYACTLGGFWIWWLVDLFRIGNLIKDRNRDIAVEIMRNMKVIGS